MKGYKAFEPGLICSGKQYAENTVFEEEKAEICKSGMHFCANPLDLLRFYPLIDKSGLPTEFAEVEALGKVDTWDYDIFCTNKLKVGKKISFSQLVHSSVNLDNCKIIHAKLDGANDAYDTTIASSDRLAKIGVYSNYVNVSAIGDYTAVGSAGNQPNIASLGNHVRIGCGGNYTKIFSVGDFASIGSSGKYARVESTGRYAVICCAGDSSIAKGKVGSWLTLSEWAFSEKEGTEIPICVKTEKIDGERIKADTFYMLYNGEFIEVKD